MSDLDEPGIKRKGQEYSAMTKDIPKNMFPPLLIIRVIHFV